MSIDSVVLFRIAKLGSCGTTLRVRHRGDASLVHTFDKFERAAAEGQVTALRQLLGSALEAHDDSRGVFAFPDVCEPKTRKYEAIVDELCGVGVWVPKVAVRAKLGTRPVAPREARGGSGCGRSRRVVPPTGELVTRVRPLGHICQDGAPF